MTNFILSPHLNLAWIKYDKNKSLLIRIFATLRTQLLRLQTRAVCVDLSLFADLGDDCDVRLIRHNSGMAARCYYTWPSSQNIDDEAGSKTQILEGEEKKFS